MDFQIRKTIRNSINQNLWLNHFQEALQTVLEADKRYPVFYWYGLIAGDIYRYYLQDDQSAYATYQELYHRGKNDFSSSTQSPYRYLLKRLSEIAFQQNEFNKAVQYYSEFIAFQPSNFHEKDFCHYAEALVKTGDKEKAILVLELGVNYSKSRLIRYHLNLLLGHDEPLTPFPSLFKGYQRIPVETDIIKPGVDIPGLIDSVTTPIRKEGDIVTIASCVVAVAEKRLRGIDEIEPSYLAKWLSRFVHNDNFPFGGNAPLCNPLSMEVALAEAGYMRILFAALLGGIAGKLFPKKGFFYRLAGEQTALIDDMPGAIPPFDYYVILGPKNSNLTAKQIREKTNCEAAIVDANDLQIAWAVGVSDPEIKPIVESVMEDNPAGNGDQKTPIILLRKV